MTERAVEFNVPGLRWDTGAPSPVVLASESRTLLAFYRQEREVEDGHEVQAVELLGCVATKFGFPNDEVLQGHRLWGAGLAFYGAHEVHESAWIDELRQIERHHPQATDAPFSEVRHFLLAFHDSTFEAVARGITVLDTYPTMAEAVRSLASEVIGA